MIYLPSYFNMFDYDSFPMFQFVWGFHTKHQILSIYLCEKRVGKKLEELRQSHQYIITIASKCYLVVCPQCEREMG